VQGSIAGQNPHPCRRLFNGEKGAIWVYGGLDPANNKNIRSVLRAG